MLTVWRDFFLDPEQRLSEQERALMTGMLADLLGTIADEIRAGLPAGLGAANDGDGQQLARQLVSAGLLDHSRLVELLLRRADEERIGNAVRARSGAKPVFLQALIAEPDEEISAAAMALILARGRRRDRLGQPRLEFDDLDRPLARDLAFAVAGAIRCALPPATRGGVADHQLESSALGLLERHDAAKRIDSVIAELVRSLIAAGKLDEGLIAAAAQEGDIGFLTHALGERSGIECDAAWDHLLDGAHGRFVLLLRLAQVSRDLAARLLAELGDLIGISDLVKEISRFESVEDSRQESAKRWLTLDPVYRASLQALGGVDG